MPVARYFPGMLSSICREAGIKVPENADNNFDNKEYQHFVVFCNLHLGRPFEDEVLIKNAEIISKIPDNKIRIVTINDLSELGVVTVDSGYMD